MKQPKKTKRIGRPKLPKGAAKAGSIRVRFQPEDLKVITATAKANKQTLSEWIRSTLNAALQR